MNKTYNKDKKHWFTAADVLITVIVLALAAGAVVLFLFPNDKASTADEVQVAMVIHLPETTVGIANGDKLFYDDTEIGTVNKIDKSANNVIVHVTLQKDGGVYLLDGEPVRINGAFVLETRLRRVSGVVESLNERGAAE